MEGIERIKKLSQESSNENIKKVAEYLINREDMEEKYLNEEKNLTDMWEFITAEAKKKAINGCAMLEDKEVYGLAVHYFDETNEDLGITKKEATTTKETEESSKKVKENSKEKTKKVKENSKYKDDDIVMKYKGRAITYKEFKEGSYLQES